MWVSTRVCFARSGGMPGRADCGGFGGSGAWRDWGVAGLPLLCRFLRASPGIVEGVFDEDFTHLNGILYSLGAEDAGPLFELGADTGAQDDARGAAISALGRLVAEDRADRDRFVQLLDGFDRMVDSPAGEWAYCSWRRRFLRCSYESSFRVCGLPSRRVCFHGPTRTGRNGLPIWMI